MVTGSTEKLTAGFDALPVLDVATLDKTTEGNRRLAALRTAGPACQGQPIGALRLLRWADCDRVLRDPTTFSSAFNRGKPVAGAETETTFDTLLWPNPPLTRPPRSPVQQPFTPDAGT